MKTEARFLLAIVLMLGVLVGTNLLFPPVVPDVPVQTDSVSVQAPEGLPTGEGTDPATPRIPEDEAASEAAQEAAPVIPGEVRQVDPAEPVSTEQLVTVEGPLYRYTFSSRGARLVSAEMTQFQSFTRDGVVELLPDGANGALGQRFVVGMDTVDLRRVTFEIEPAAGLVLAEDSGPGTIRFVYQHPTSDFRVEIEYEFVPDVYAVQAEGRVDGLRRPLVVTDIGDGLQFAEADSVGEVRAMAYVGNHLRDGIKSTPLNRPDLGLREGPFLWAAFRSKFFVMALLAPESDAAAAMPKYLGGLFVSQSALPERAHVAVAQTVADDGLFGYRLFLGPQEYGRLESLGQDMEGVNPYGWKFVRPIVSPFVSVITKILTFFHNSLNLSYGWVLILFGVLMRVVLFPLNHKAMKAQLRNMAVQPLVQEIQAKHKENPEKLQKEMMKLYKDHGFNPLAGCLPMLLPWPILIALFFVFQNTIELRGVPFLWLPDLSAPDPLYLLPVFLGISMFLMQWVSLRSLDQTNPQMKMMMWLMPIMMVFIFFRLASGLNLYYAVANIATIPQQVWIANERKKVQAKGPPKAAEDE
jgi:YidC/Oxa1 family membrane protein insertase